MYYSTCDYRRSTEFGEDSRRIASNTNSQSISYKSRWFVVVQFIARLETTVAFGFLNRKSALRRRIILRSTP